MGCHGVVTRYAQSMQGYPEEACAALLGEAGFPSLAWWPALSGAPEPEQANMGVIVAWAAGWLC